MRRHPRNHRDELHRLREGFAKGFNRPCFGRVPRRCGNFAARNYGLAVALDLRHDVEHGKFRQSFQRQPERPDVYHFHFRFGDLDQSCGDGGRIVADYFRQA